MNNGMYYGMPPSDAAAQKEKTKRFVILMVSVVLIILILSGVALLCVSIIRKTDVQADPPTVTVLNAGNTAPVLGSPDQTTDPGGASGTAMAAGSYQIGNTNSPVVIRTEPGDLGSPVCSLAPGAGVEVMNLYPVINGYTQVCFMYNGLLASGWIPVNLLIYTGAPGFTAGVTSPQMIYNANAFIGFDTPGHYGVNVRAAATSLSSKRGLLPEGTGVFACGQVERGYALIIVNPGTSGAYYGWVLKRYLYDYSKTGSVTLILNTPPAAPAPATAAPVPSAPPAPTVPETTAAPATAAPPVTAAPATAAPPVTAAPSSQPADAKGVPAFTYGQYLEVMYNTPSHLGLTVRERPDQNSKKLEQIPEGEVLYALGESSGKYVKVTVHPASSALFYQGWVLGEYVQVTDREPETYAVPMYDVSGGDYASYSPNDAVGYNTPSHAGLVVRADGDANSAQVGRLKEGDPVFRFGATKGRYVNIIAYPGTDHGFDGWVLAEYLQSGQ